MLFILSIFSLPAMATNLIHIENGGKNYLVTIWNHQEDIDDKVVHKNYSESELLPIVHILKDKQKMRVIFNNGVFTSMDYYDARTRRWANLTQSEKDAVFYLQEKFDITEK